MTSAITSGSKDRVYIGNNDFQAHPQTATLDVSLNARINAPRFQKVRLEAYGNTASLKVSGGPQNNFHVEIEIPQRSDLLVRLSVGHLEVKDVEGNTDVENLVGDVEIAMSHPESYGQRDASVNIGDVDASAFGVSKGGFFRSFHQLGPGKYRLHAHVGIGDITFRGTL